MHYFISTEFSITLFGFLSFLASNNRIENLTLITKFRGAWGIASFACRSRLPWYSISYCVIRYLSVSYIFWTVILLITLILTVIYWYTTLFLWFYNQIILNILNISRNIRNISGQVKYLKYLNVSRNI